MGHTVGKDLYRKLGRKIDGLTMRVPWSETLCAILKELYTPEEAELVVRLPYGLADLERIRTVTGQTEAELRPLLDTLCEKGLVLDIWAGEKYHYTISPLVIGIFEFTMMRTRGNLRHAEWARLFHDYIQGDSGYYEANLGHGQSLSPLRTLPHEDVIDENGHVEILDYEKASVIVDRARTLAIGVCSCRHEKLHTGAKPCDIPLETCSSFNGAADILIRHGMARAVSRREMQDNLARSRELGLVLCADNVRREIAFICHCCGCCCNVLLGISRFGYPNILLTSNFLARVNADECIGCGACAAACPIAAINDETENTVPVVDDSACIGCGVCALSCPTASLKLVSRDQRVFCPEDSFERIILQSLDQGTLQNLLFSNPNSSIQGVLRAFVGGFLRLPPVKRSLTSERLRSRFLTFLRDR